MSQIDGILLYVVRHEVVKPREASRLEPNIPFLGKGYDTSTLRNGKTLNFRTLFVVILSTVDSCRSYLDDRNKVVIVS